MLNPARHPGEVESTGNSLPFLLSSCRRSGLSLLFSRVAGVSLLSSFLIVIMAHFFPPFSFSLYLVKPSDLHNNDTLSSLNQITANLSIILKSKPHLPFNSLNLVSDWQNSKLKFTWNWVYFKD